MESIGTTCQVTAPLILKATTSLMSANAAPWHHHQISREQHHRGTSNSVLRRYVLPRWSASTSRSGELRARLRPASSSLEYLEAAREMTRRPDGGPPRWFSPLECRGAGGRTSGLPTLMYLPGIDGVGLGLIRHHERLANLFSMWCLHIPTKDRTSFERIVEYVENTVKMESSGAPDKPIYLLGESIGACIALAVAARNRDIDLILILVNPGTSFHRSQLRPLCTFLDLVPESFQLGSFMKMPLTIIGLDTFLEGVQALSEIVTSLLPTLTFLVDILAKESISWKLKLMGTASTFVNTFLHDVKSQTLVIASGYDELLPSREEAKRLQCELENCRIRHFKDDRHNILLEGQFDVATTIKVSGYYRRSRQKDFVSDYVRPTPEELEKAIDRFRAFNVAVNPVILSTLPGGKIVRGLAVLPKEGPAVLVGYHMLMGFEVLPLIAGVLRSTGINFRSLAHPFLFNKNSEQLIPDSSFFDEFRQFGAVPVTGINFYKLLSQKNFVLLYPGGTRELLHRKREEYKLFWPDQPEFVRMASRFGATIIPFGVVGEDDICDVLLDYNDLMKLPLYDILDKKINQEDVKIRNDSMGEARNQQIHPMVVTPKVPGRFYFIFGKPIETRGREKEIRDKENAQHLYLHVKSEVESCMHYLKEKRKVDPYRGILPRLLYQAVHGPNTEIPTFEL